MKFLKYGLFTVLFFSSCWLAYSLYASILEKDAEIENIKTADENVIKRLIQIREIQRLYFDEYHQYADSWPKMIDFAKNGNIHLIQKKERVIARPSGIDSVYVQYDTIGVEPSYRLINEKLGMTRTDLDSMMVVPNSHEQFTLYANELQGIWVVEISDPAPVNPRRQKEGDLKPLKIGSKVQSTLKGNWE